MVPTENEFSANLRSTLKVQFCRVDLSVKEALQKRKITCTQTHLVLGYGNQLVAIIDGFALV